VNPNLVIGQILITTSATTIIIKEMVYLFISLALYFTSPGKLSLTNLYLISGVYYFKGKHNSYNPPGIAIPGDYP
jgi:hypothetical protein